MLPGMKWVTSLACPMWKKQIKVGATMRTGTVDPGEASWVVIVELNGLLAVSWTSGKAKLKNSLGPC